MSCVLCLLREMARCALLVAAKDIKFVENLPPVVTVPSVPTDKAGEYEVIVAANLRVGFSDACPCS